MIEGVRGRSWPESKLRARGAKYLFDGKDANRGHLPDISQRLASTAQRAHDLQTMLEPHLQGTSQNCMIA
jgi:hypothetical protein